CVHIIMTTHGRCGHQEFRPVTILDAHTYPVSSVVFDPVASSRLITGSFDGQARLWDIRTGKMQAAFAGPKAEIFCVALSPDGKLISAAYGWDGIWLWNARTGNVLAQLDKGGRVACVAFSLDGRMLASGHFN